MIVTISQISQEFTKNGAEYRKITGATGDGKETTKSIFDNLQDKWGLLKEGATLNFKMVKKGQFWNVEDINPVELPPPQPHDGVLPEHQDEIDKARTSVTPPAPQAVGMMTKETGDMIRAGMLESVFGKETAVELTKWYRGQALGITRIPYNGKDLPKEAKSEATEIILPSPISSEVDENERTQTVLDEGERELTYGYLKALADKKGVDITKYLNENIPLLMDIAGLTIKQAFQKLEGSKKKLLVGGLK